MAGARGTGWGKLVGTVLGGAAAAAAGTVVTRAIAAGRPAASETGAATSDRTALSQVFSPARPGVAERLSRMVQLPTVSATVDQTGPADFTAFEALLRDFYPLIHQHLSFEKTGEFGLLYRWTGASADQPIVLMAHYDVVPAVEEDGWTDPPFAGVIRDGVVYGRGTLDDKGPLIVILEAVENLLADGYSPARDIYLAFGGNEESYGSAAARTADLLHERGISPWLVLDEGGAVIDSPFPGVSVPLAMVGVAEKGIMTVRISAETAGGHASAPAKDSATGRIAHAILRLGKGPFPVSLPAPTQAMLRGLAPHAGFPLRLVVSNLWLFHRPVAALFAALGGETEAMTRTTVAVTMIDGGTAANVLAAKATATLNIRLAVGETPDGVLERLRTVVADPKISYEVLEASAPSPVSPSDNAQFAAVRAAVDATYPGTVTSPYVMMAGTDSRHFHQYWPAVYRFSPLAMTAEQRAAIHGINEHVTIDSLERGDRFFQTLIRSRQH